MNNEIWVNERLYTFVESFDTNLCLTYENDSWGTWHILREFISNAIDAVQGDISKVRIISEGGFTYIHDEGSGFSLKFAKRIGASSKKEDPSSIGQFGEGSKLAILTCIRNGIGIKLCSQNWLVIPRVVEMEDQQILFYNIYECESPVSGSIVIVEITEEIRNITENLSSYFLQFNSEACLFGDIARGIFPLVNNMARLYNKGVFIKEIDAVFSYGISLEKLNRDRDLISHGDMAYEIRDIWEKVDNKELIKRLMTIAAHPSDFRSNLIEFYARLYSYNPSAWAEAFTELFGNDACLYSNDIATREAKELGLSVIQFDNGISSILKSGGIRFDSDGLSDEYEFEFAHVSREEKEMIEKLSNLAEMAGFSLPDSIKVFDIYKSNPDILGIYNQDSCQIYLKRDILSDSLENALHVLLHEANHNETKADDVSREFSDSLSRKLARLAIMVSSKLGQVREIEIDNRGIKLPAEVLLSASDMEAVIAVVGNEIIVKVGSYTLDFELMESIIESKVYKRRIILKKSCYIVTLPKEIMEAFRKYPTIKCYIH